MKKIKFIFQLRFEGKFTLNHLIFIQQKQLRQRQKLECERK